jgi:hypothetical protein
MNIGILIRECIKTVAEPHESCRFDPINALISQRYCRLVASVIAQAYTDANQSQPIRIP